MHQITMNWSKHRVWTSSNERLITDLHWFMGHEALNRSLTCRVSFLRHIDTHHWSSSFNTIISLTFFCRTEWLIFTFHCVKWHSLRSTKEVKGQLSKQRSQNINNHIIEDHKPPNIDLRMSPSIIKTTPNHKHLAPEKYHYWY